MNPAVSRRLCALVLSLVLPELAPEASAQVYLETPNVSFAGLSFVRQWSYVQTEPSMVVPRIGKAYAAAFVWTSSPIPIGVRLEVEGAAYPISSSFNGCGVRRQ